MKIRALLAILLLIPFTQNCSRRTIRYIQPHVITKHSTPHDFSKLQFRATNFPAGFQETDVALDYDMLNHSVEITSVYSDGRHCQKSFPMHPAMADAFQRVLHVLTYEVVETAPHFYGGDKFVTLTNPLGTLNLVLDSSVIPNGIPTILDPAALHYMIQGLLITAGDHVIEHCQALDSQP